ncbi:MAG: helix-turn-helix transcriptional regulator [Victivallales bacterium]|nr:helix-turn-helix transcriptional regulator [Victivallales bacterium]
MDWSQILKPMEREGFVQLLRHIAEGFPQGRVVVSQAKPDLPSYAIHSSIPLIDVVLSGRKHILYPGDGEVKDDCLSAGEMIFSPPNTTKLPIWDLPHEMSGLVFASNMLRVTYIRVDEPLPASQHGIIAPYFYHTSYPVGETCLALLQLLEVESRRPNSAPMVQALMRALLRKVLEEVMQDTFQPYGKSQLTWLRLKDYVDMNFLLPIDRRSVASALKLNPGYVTRLFLEHSGKPFVEYLRELRLAHARKLLLETDLTIDEVTVQCGYSSSTFFIAAFRRLFGVSPGRFRNRAQADRLANPSHRQRRMD